MSWRIQFTFSDNKSQQNRISQVSAHRFSIREGKNVRRAIGLHIESDVSFIPFGQFIKLPSRRHGVANRAKLL